MDHGRRTIDATKTTKTLRIAALGPRFSLEPQLVVGKFPPEKSLGEYYTVMPHIVLQRSTLPWERKVADTPAYADAPWLALLLFTKEENIVPKTITLDELTKPQQDLRFPKITLEPGQQKN